MRIVYLALGWAAGILLAANGWLPPVFWLLVMAILTTLAWWGCDNRWHIIALTILCFAAGGFRYTLVPQSSDIARFNNTGGVFIEGVVVDEPDIRDDRIQLRMAAEQVAAGAETFPTEGLVLVNAPRLADVAYGDRVQASGQLIAPAEFDTFSYADYLARDSVFSIMDNAVVDVIGQGGGNPLSAALIDLKSQTQAQISQYLPEPSGALLSGILLGNERGISPELNDAFSKTGASHIIAISGFNMAIISGVVMGILGRLMPNRRVLPVVIGTAFLVIYTLFVGANPAVIRAAVMSSLLVIAPLFRRKTYVPASLAFVAMLMSLQNPTVLWSISFQLSFFAVLGLSLFVDPLDRAFDKTLAFLFPGKLAKTIAGILNEPLIVTLAAQIATMPLTILYFQRLSLVSQIVNLLIVPVQTYLLFVGAIATMLSFLFAPVAQVLFWMDMLLLNYSIGVVRAFGQLPNADTAFFVDPRLIALFYFSVIGGAMVSATRPAWLIKVMNLIRSRILLSAVVFSGLALFILMWGMFRSRPDGDFHLWLLDAGHSNAVLMQTPGGAHILVDGGRFPTRLLTTLGDTLPFYDREIELLFVTQPDDFDTGALPAVLERYSVGTVITNGHPNQSEAQAALAAAIAPYEQLTVKAGYTMMLDDGVLIEVLNPSTQPELGDSLNDFALVLRVTYGEMSFLLTSDLSRSTQGALLENGQYPLADVMTLPQHGTARSLDEHFLVAVQPSVILLQTDATNRRGDPDGGVLALLDEIPVLRTDDGGTWHLWTDGNELWAQPTRKN
ncbi:MAG: ComEC/Rec2 family competence protein [Aggregatilineales bacterium]